MGANARVRAQAYNACAHEPSLDQAALCALLDDEVPGLYARMAQAQPAIFAPVAVALSPADSEQILNIIAAVEAVLALPAYHAHVDAGAPTAAGGASCSPGAFAGFDFHVGETGQGPQLIEINSNAGGAALLLKMLQAHRGAARWTVQRIHALECAIVDMFRAEWRALRGDAVLRRVLIVDDDPRSQYLWPDFALFQRLFERHGIAADIADAALLEGGDQGVFWQGEPVDMIYNRLTDFYFEAPHHDVLSQAWASGSVVITPHPRAHARYANKRHLAILSDETLLRRWGVSAQTRAILIAGIPRTQAVDSARMQEFWAQRKSLFFKPSGGYGSKAVYQGDRITRTVFERIMHEDYVAQSLAPPGLRQIVQDGVSRPFKFDLRHYAYAGQSLLCAARLWRGQTMNFRTPGSGFAPVLAMEEP
jgi:hypothetical protein